MPVHLQSASAAPRLLLLARDPGEANEKSGAAAAPPARRKAPPPPPLPYRPLQLNPHAPFRPDADAAQAQRRRMEPLQMNDLQSAFLSDTMVELRERAAKRRRTTGDGVGPSVAFVDGDCDRGDVASSGGRFDILDELDARPGVVRVVATAGGLITHCT